MKVTRLLAGVLFLAFSATQELFASDAPVKVWEEQVVIPTYLMGPPEQNPQFYFGAVSQGAQQRAYPYPLYDNLTTKKVDKTYMMVYLENEYVRIGIVPELGGRIFEAIDKTNGYSFIYRQHVIKPALISPLGAWISGGIEWNVPQHHRSTTFLPIQYKIDQDPDGSKTVWVGELALQDRMRWAIGVTLHPGKSYLEGSFRVVNQTPLPTSMLCFTNLAVSVNDTYQIIFPPSTHYVTFHTKNSFTTWPIATTRFAGQDFTSGVDVSMYKNHLAAISMFAWNYRDDFFAGYDHGRNAGVLSIADHNIVPGKKFFTWGNGKLGKEEEKLLTDSDGPYIELMSGAYSDNQPDYSWMAPFETRTWTQYWYPFRDIDGVKNANRDAAVNMKITDGKLQLGFYTTAAYHAAHVTVRLKDTILLDEETQISPSKPWVRSVGLPAGVKDSDLHVSLSGGGRKLIDYSPHKEDPEAMPAPVTDPYPAAAKIATTEELYLTGLRAEQFHSPVANAQTYWEEALRRDPGDVRANTAMGIDCLRAGRFSDAEAYLKEALERDTANYTSPKDAEPLYYLGMALKAQGKYDEAFSVFAKAAWSEAWRGPGSFEMAEVESLRGKDEAALAYTNTSLGMNATNTPALKLQAALLRKSDHEDKAQATVARLRAVDPLDTGGLAEQWLITKNSNDAAALKKAFRTSPQTALETATGYMNAGLWKDGSAILRLAIDSFPKQSGMSILAYYYLGYFDQKLHLPDVASEDFRRASQGDTEYAFPFQMEMISVFEAAMTVNPADTHAPYLLGNLLYDWQPARAIDLWQKSASLHADFPEVYRNLALVESRTTNDPVRLEDARDYLEKAVSVGGDGMVLNDLDKLNEEKGILPVSRLEVLEQHTDKLDRDSIVAREINLKIVNGQYDQAIALLQSRFFHAWEGGDRFSLGNSWISAHLLAGQQLAVARHFNEALVMYKAALSFPENLLEAIGNVDGRRAEISYRMGTVYEALNKKEEAIAAFSDATKQVTENSAEVELIPKRGLASGIYVPGAAKYYQALALEKLDESERARILFEQLKETGKLQVAKMQDKPSDFSNTYVRSEVRSHLGDAYLTEALGNLGLGEKIKAQQELEQALRISPDDLMAKTTLQSIDHP
jgi:tetratricopeptide (TPR) repeat protein